MIRTTFQSVQRHTQSVIQGRFSDLAALQQKMATGKQLTRPSDGAIETANVLKLKTQNSQLKQYGTNMNDGLAWMQISDTAMTSMVSIIHRAKELAIQGNSDTLSSSERKYINDEIEQLTMQMASLMNTKYKGDYIFSGTHTNKAAVVLKETKDNSQAKSAFEMSFFDTTSNPPAILPKNVIRYDDNLNSYVDSSGNAIKFPQGFPVGDAIQIFNPNGNQYGGATSDNMVNKIIPGSLEIKVSELDYSVTPPAPTGKIVEMRENIDYVVDYTSGKMWLVDTERKYFPNGIMPNVYDPSKTDYPAGYQTSQLTGYDSTLPTTNPRFIEDDKGRLIDNPKYDPAYNPLTDTAIRKIIEDRLIENGASTPVPAGDIDDEIDKYTSIDENGVRSFNPKYVQSDKPHPMLEQNGFEPGTSTTPPKYANGFSMRMNYFTESKDIYGDTITTNGKILRQIEENVSLEINTNFDDLSVGNGNTIFTALIELGQGLLQGNSSTILKAMDDLDANMNKILSAQAINGAVVNRFDSTHERNKYMQVEVTRLQSDLEDADYAEVITNYSIMYTIYQAALSSTAKIMQTSLANYLR